MFLFQRIKEPDACPDCGSLAITEASEEQQVEFEVQQEAVKNELW